MAREVFDVTGAGDTVSAVMALGLAAGASLAEAASIGQSCSRRCGGQNWATAGVTAYGNSALALGNGGPGKGNHWPTPLEALEPGVFFGARGGRKFPSWETKGAFPTFGETVCEKKFTGLPEF